MYNFTMHGALDQMRNGITCALNHSQSVAPTYTNYMEQYAAEMDAGQHFIYSYVLDKNEADFAVRKAKLVFDAVRTEMKQRVARILKAAEG